MHAGEQVGVDDILGGRRGNHTLVAFDGVGFLGRDESRADIGEVSAEYARRADGASIAHRPRQRNRSIEPLPGFGNERERRQFAGVTARTGGDQNQAVGPLLDRLVRKLLVDDVVKHDAAPAMRGLVQFLARTERGDDHRHLVLLAKGEIVIQPIVRFVHDLVHGERRRRTLRVRLVIGRKFFLDARQPLVEQRRRPRIQRRKRADDAGLALGDHQVRHRDDEQRCADDRYRQAALEQGRHGHSRFLSSLTRRRAIRPRQRRDDGRLIQGKAIALRAGRKSCAEMLIYRHTAIYWHIARVTK